MRNSNGVIITVYVESKNLRSDFRKKDPIMNKLQFSLKNRVLKTRGGYDRRAQLLAYAQKLRHANSKPKLNKWRWRVAMEKMRRLIMMRSDGKGYYESIATEDYSGKQQRMNEGRKGRRRRRYSHFCKKMRCLLKKIFWKCKIGSFVKGA